MPAMAARLAGSQHEWLTFKDPPIRIRHVIFLEGIYYQKKHATKNM